MNVPHTALSPLRGIKVIDFTHVLAGPACSYYLGLLGADVIKVESAGVGDCMRHRGGSDDDRSDAEMSTAYLTQGAGKRSIAVDLSRPEGIGVMRDLLKGADVFVENHRLSTMQRLGLTYEDVREINPGIIHCSMTGYGRTGHKADAPAYDVNIQAACGLMTLTGTADSGPTRTGAPVMDYGTAMAAGFAISSALFARAVQGQGTFIDVSMLETGLALMSSTVTDFLSTGNVPKPAGNAANSRSPGAGCFETREGLLSLGVNEEHQFWALAEVVGCGHWRDDPRFKDRRARKQHESYLQDSLSDALRTRSAEEWEQLMLSAGVPAARVKTLPEILAEAQVLEREFVHHFDDGVCVPTLPFRFGDSGSRKPQQPAPLRGEHSCEILRDLGLRDAEIAELIANQVVEQAGQDTDDHLSKS